MWGFCSGSWRLWRQFRSSKETQVSLVSLCMPNGKAWAATYRNHLGGSSPLGWLVKKKESYKRSSCPHSFFFGCGIHLIAVEMLIWLGTLCKTQISNIKQIVYTWNLQNCPGWKTHFFSNGVGWNHQLVIDCSIVWSALLRSGQSSNGNPGPPGIFHHASRTFTTQISIGKNGGNGLLGIYPINTYYVRCIKGTIPRVLPFLWWKWDLVFLKRVEPGYLRKKKLMVGSGRRFGIGFRGGLFSRVDSLLVLGIVYLEDHPRCKDR